MSRLDAQFNFRVERKNFQAVKAAALIERRSLTAQMNLIIEEWRKRQEEVKA